MAGGGQGGQGGGFGGGQGGFDGTMGGTGSGPGGLGTAGMGGFGGGTGGFGGGRFSNFMQNFGGNPGGMGGMGGSGGMGGATPGGYLNSFSPPPAGLPVMPPGFGNSKDGSGLNMPPPASSDVTYTGDMAVLSGIPEMQYGPAVGTPTTPGGPRGPYLQPAVMPPQNPPQFYGMGNNTAPIARVPGPGDAGFVNGTGPLLVKPPVTSFNEPIMSSRDLNLNTGLPSQMGTAQTGLIPTNQFMTQYGSGTGGFGGAQDKTYRDMQPAPYQPAITPPPIGGTMGGPGFGPGGLGTAYLGMPGGMPFMSGFRNAPFMGRFSRLGDFLRGGMGRPNFDVAPPATGNASFGNVPILPPPPSPPSQPALRPLPNVTRTMRAGGITSLLKQR